MTESNVELSSEDTMESDVLRPLIEREISQSLRSNPLANLQTGIIVGELLGMVDDGRTPLVCYPGQPGTAAIAARTTIDLHGQHIGQQVVLVFEGNHPEKPIIMGVIQGKTGWPLDKQPNQVEVDADGERMIVSAKEQLVLRCGKASITLTKTGKVLIKGSYVLSRSSGVNRIKGGSVQLN